jgi:large subunit ribosomal protein L21
VFNIKPNLFTPPPCDSSKKKGKIMYAIVETGGKQYQVEEGRYIDVELLEGEADSKIVFDKVVMIVNGKKSKVGQPYVSGASAEGKIMAAGKDGDVVGKAKKIIVYKQRPKKGYRRKQGHRQRFTRVMISKIRTSAAKKSATTEETAEA